MPEKKLTRHFTAFPVCRLAKAQTLIIYGMETFNPTLFCVSCKINWYHYMIKASVYMDGNQAARRSIKFVYMSLEARSPLAAPQLTLEKGSAKK